jgi:hypothetical protein
VRCARLVGSCLPVLDGPAAAPQRVPIMGHRHSPSTLAEARAAARRLPVDALQLRHCSPGCGAVPRHSQSMCNAPPSWLAHAPPWLQRPARSACACAVARSDVLSFRSLRPRRETAALLPNPRATTTATPPPLKPPGTARTVCQFLQICVARPSSLPIAPRRPLVSNGERSGPACSSPGR